MFKSKCDRRTDSRANSRPDYAGNNKILSFSYSLFVRDVFLKLIISGPMLSFLFSFFDCLWRLCFLTDIHYSLFVFFCSVCLPITIFFTYKLQMDVLNILDNHVFSEQNIRDICRTLTC